MMSYGMSTVSISKKMILYFSRDSKLFASLWDPWAMILMGPRALEMSPIIDVFIQRKF